MQIHYDQHSDILTIEGTRYAGGMFRELGCNFPGMVGQLLRVVRKEDGVVTCMRVDEAGQSGRGAEGFGSTGN